MPSPIIGQFTCISDRRSAEEVGELLERFQVGRVVLTACRSTQHSGPGGTIPRVLRRYGVHEIVAMSYQVLSRCVQHFTLWFYAILFATRSMPFAVHCGRKSIAHSAERFSRFGTEIRITDDIVPVYYQSQEWIQRDDLIQTASRFSELVIDNDRPEDEPPVGFGREHDLLKLECMLLESGRPVIVVGEPGIGKSVLLAMLVQWWDCTGCAVATHIFQLSQDKSFTVDKMCRALHLEFHCPEPYNGQQSIIPFLRARRYLIIIDSLESMTVAAPTVLGDQHVALMKFIRALRGGKTVVVIGSRREYSSLASHTFPFPISGLKIMPALQLMRSATRLARKNVLNLRSADSMGFLSQAGPMMGLDLANEDTSGLVQEVEALKQRTDSGLQSLFSTWDTHEDGIYLEEIHKLVNGHPLVLAILTRNMMIFGSELSPKRFMLGLLEGAPMITDLKAVPGGDDLEIEGLRSLDELKTMITDLQTEIPFVFTQLIALLATFWGVIPTQSLDIFQKFEIKESANSSDRNTELIDMIDKLLSAGLCGNISTDLKDSLDRLRTEQLSVLDQRRIQLQICEYMDAEGLLEKFPQMKPVLKGLRETLSLIPSVDPAVLQINEAMNSHEGFFLFNGIRDALLESPNGPDESMKDSIRSWSSWDDFCLAFAGGGQATEQAAELQNTLTFARSSLIQPGLKALIASHLLSIPSSDHLSSDHQSQAGTSMEYIKTSPLLTIMLRGHPVWYDNKKSAASHKVALALLYAHRCQTWPAPIPTTHTPAWQAARVETDIEFYNFASAATSSKDQLRDKKMGFFVEEAMMDSIMKLDWHCMHKMTRAPIVQMLWESCLEDAQQTVKTLENSKDRPQKRSWPAQVFSPLPEKDIPLEQRQTELRLFSRRSASVVLATGLLKFYNQFDDARSRRCGEIIKTNIRDIQKVCTNLISRQLF